jgi:hypothetical protein
METRVHAKCLRSVASVRNYFREYRAKKKHEQGRVRRGRGWGGRGFAVGVGWMGRVR